MANRTLRSRLGCALIVAALALMTLSGLAWADSAADDWTTLVEDAAGDAQGGTGDPRADLVRASAREEGDRLWLKLETKSSSPANTSAPTPSLPLPLPTGTAPSPQAAADVSSRMSFIVARAKDGASGTFDLLADRDGFRLMRDGHRELSNAVVMPDEATAWSYEIGLLRWALFDDGSYAPGDRLHHVTADIRTEENPATTDRAPDSGFAGEFVHSLGPDGQVVPTWKETEGVDFGAGPDVAADADGDVHVSYIVYASDRGTDKGLYHAVVTDEGWSAERVADARLPEEIHQDAKTATAIALDSAGGVHIAYHPEAGVGSAGQIRYAHGGGGATWQIEDPAALADGTKLNVENGHRAVPDIVSEQRRVIVAFQRADADALSIVERQDSGGWVFVRTLSPARFARLDIDGEGKLHAAWFKPIEDGYPNRGVDGALIYATEKDGWTEHTIASEGLTDITRFWERAEGDGSFDFRLDARGVPNFLYDHGRGQSLATFHDGEINEVSAPLKPVHGNPQYRIRMGFDAAGNLHALSGYGGSDHYAFRSAEGYWNLQDNGRQDMFSLAVRPDGRAVMAYTQPHGGTTVAVSIQGSVPHASDEDENDLAPIFLPGPGGAAAMVVLGGLGIVGARWGLPALADHRPRMMWRGLALAGAGFSRLHKDKLLEHETRDTMVAAARDAPGRSAADLRRDLELPQSTFFYHLRRLEQEGLVRLAREGPQLFVYAGPAASPTLVSPSTLDSQILAAVAAAPGLSAAEYATRLQRHPRNVHHRLLRMARQGRLSVVRTSARDVRWQPVSQPAN